MAETNDVFSHLSLEQTNEAVQECQLAQQTSYTQQEIDLFPQERLSVDEGNTRPPEETNDPAHEQSKPIDSLGLLTLVSGQLGSSISLIEAGKILLACGLPEVEQYTTQEGDRFLEACILIKHQGKTLEEVALHFGLTLKDDVLIEKVHGLLERVSATQAQQIRTALPQMAVEQLQAVKSMFWKMTARRLRQYVDSGQLETEIRQASENILATAGKYLGLLGSNSSPKNLKSLLG